VVAAGVDGAGVEKLGKAFDFSLGIVSLLQTASNAEMADVAVSVIFNS